MLLTFPPRNATLSPVTRQTPRNRSLMPLTRVACLVALAFSLVGCSSLHQRACLSGEQLFVNESLYFGTVKPTGVVTPAEWAEFLKNTVTPRFPQGLTVWQASGQWRGSDGEIVREESRVLNLVHPNDSANEKAVLEIVSAYKSQFQQEAVLRAKAQTCTSF